VYAKRVGGEGEKKGEDIYIYRETDRQTDTDRDNIMALHP
jgi:hypothetical protein